MISLNNIGLHFGDRTLLSGVTFMLNRRERAGLVGKNGAGKSTLFRIISNQQSADEGTVEHPKHFSMGYLKQDLHFDGNNTVMEETKACFSEVGIIEKEISEITDEMNERTDYESDSYMELVEELTDLNARLDLLAPGKIDAQCERILKGLGFKEEDFIKKVSQFSGGWQMRIELAKLLLTQPDLLLLDEPTNHLDIESIIWLEEYLGSYPGIVLLISHDKQFLNNVCNRIFELEWGKLSSYAGNYDKYIVEKEMQREVLASAYVNQQKQIAEKERTISRFMAKATKTSMAQSMQKQLDKIERIEVPEFDTKAFKLKFPEAARTGRVVLEVKNISKSFGPKLVLKDVNFAVEKGEKIAFVGQNGMGKTTMAKMITAQLMADSGTMNFGSNVALGYYAQNQSELIDVKKTVLEVMEENAPAEQRTNIRNILGSFLFSGDDVEKKVSVLSGGERARLAMACMILRPSNLVIMDEPTNHLDIQSKEVLKQALTDFEGTLIIVSHDREFLQQLCTKVYEFTNHTVKEYLGDINYFLEKKKMTDIREIDTRKDKGAASATPVVEVRVDHEEIKKARRRMQYVERDIEKLEGEIASLSEQLNDPAIYQSDKVIDVNRKLLERQEKLNALMEEWETLVGVIG
ncbi:MAG TPA: ABC-F family ATP-binding cassette domain-containing protein [Saprospiraceae bacterium]|nr:ABC-F family ATP-binding cassette domain-containing protein [Saprospiraceae bacterium]